MSGGAKRREHGLTHEKATAFGRVAADYERVRPGYPPDLIDWLTERLGLRPGRVVVDLAAGTGKLTRLLVPTGADVIAVEPSDEMRHELERMVPRAKAFPGTAERIPLEDGSADAMTVAQAFHWFDVAKAAQEIGRVLRPASPLALIWNLQDKHDPLVAAIEVLSTRAWGGRKAFPAGEGTWEAPMRASGLFGSVEQRRFPWTHTLAKEDLVDQFGTTSAVAALSPGLRRELMDEARAVMAAYPDPVVQSYTSHVFLCTRR